MTRETDLVTADNGQRESATNTVLRMAVVSVREPMLAHAVRGVLHLGGWIVHSSIGPGIPRIIDEPLPESNDHDVLVCGRTPVECAAALRRLTARDVSAVVPDDLLGSIPEILSSLHQRRILLELEMITRASLVPDLDPRQIAVLAGLLAGQSANDVSTRSHLSIATVKRTISQLFKSFGVGSTIQLLPTAAALGYRARAVIGPIPEAQRRVNHRVEPPMVR